jgi:hypothetical protein
MKGWSFILAIITPLKAPNKAPTTSAEVIPNKRDPLCKKDAPTIAAKANTEPTDKSIPPERMTKVIPNAIVALIEICLSILNKFETDRNQSERIENSITIPINPKMIGNLLKIITIRFN